MIKAFIFYWYSKIVVYRDNSNNPVQSQLKILKKAIKFSKNSQFSNFYNLTGNECYEEFVSKVPILNYLDYLPYIEKIKNGETNILSSQKISYLLHTSGTTSGSKYIPITKLGIKHQLMAAQLVLCFHTIYKGNADWIKDKMIFLQGSPLLSNKYKVKSGRLSGVIYHYVPKFFQSNKLPTFKSNIIENWETKIEEITKEMLQNNVSVIGGIPPWCLQLFEKLLNKTGKKTLNEIWPNLSIYIYGGLDFLPYAHRIKEKLGEKIDCYNTFPASEGFFAISDSPYNSSMKLLCNSGIFYEFRELESNKIYTLDNVKINTNYELIITNLSGFYRYSMGDIIVFERILPYYISVKGRTSQYISAFGEHVIGWEIEQTFEKWKNIVHIEIYDYHVCPNVEESCYYWYIEPIYNLPNDPKPTLLNILLSEYNPYFKDLIENKLIKTSKIVWLKKGTFDNYRKKTGKWGGQNKVVHLKNDHSIGRELIEIQEMNLESKN